MPDAEELLPEPFELIKLDVVFPARVDLQRVPAAFGPDEDWLGERLAEERSGPDALRATSSFGSGLTAA